MKQLPPPIKPSLALELAGVIVLKLALLTVIWFAFFADQPHPPAEIDAVAHGLLDRVSASTPPQPPHPQEGASSHAHR
ncbi:cytochrome oxidase putative small subunit CydP [Azovibrio restrictus]|uniref:cytochrome oxidase putative small subunit CydP n=1 Tax=Azovibrio restrictus TaxID=146938 RepID=UPI0026EE5679|nr:cytochrome oxidase putative small subunit CydP [Azovibrio restrictus]